jgi:high-affinity Fe2+/Pb2+ permease
MLLAFMFLLTPKYESNALCSKNGLITLSTLFMQLSVLLILQGMLGKKTHSKALRYVVSLFMVVCAFLAFSFIFKIKTNPIERDFISLIILYFQMRVFKVIFSEHTLFHLPHHLSKQWY